MFFQDAGSYNLQPTDGTYQKLVVRCESTCQGLGCRVPGDRKDPCFQDNKGIELDLIDTRPIHSW